MPGTERFVPELDIAFAGKSVGRAVLGDVVRVAYADNVETLGSFEILLNNWDPDKARVKYSDGNLFDLGRKLELKLGYAQPGLQSMIHGEITALSPVFPVDRHTRLVVSGLDVLHQFRGEPVSAIYTETKDSEIAERIGSRLGVTVRTDSSAKGAEPKLDYLLQDNQLDVVFLLERARRNGYDLVVEGEKKLFFGPTEKIGGARTRVTYGRSTLHFEPRLSSVDQVEAVTVRCWDPLEKKTIEHTASLAGTTSRKKEILVHQPVESLLEAKRLAEATLRRLRKEALEGEGSLVGTPALKAGTFLDLDGLDKRFDGAYFVCATRHVFDDRGYLTEFRCRREPA